MKNRTIALAILGGLILSVLVPFAVPAAVSAQACTDARGNQIECPAIQDNGKKKKPSPTRPRDYKSPTPTPATYQTPTTVPTETQVPTPTKPPPVVLPGDDSHLLTNSFAGPFSFWWLGLLALLLGGGLGFVGFFNRRKVPPEPPIKPGDESAFHKGGTPGFDKMEAQPHMQPGGDGSGPVAEYEEIAELEEVSHIDPGDPGSQKGGAPGSEQMSAPGPPDSPGSDKMGAQPQMKPGQDGFMK